MTVFHKIFSPTIVRYSRKKSCNRIILSEAKNLVYAWDAMIKLVTVEMIKKIQSLVLREPQPCGLFLHSALSSLWQQAPFHLC